MRKNKFKKKFHITFVIPLVFFLLVFGCLEKNKIIFFGSSFSSHKIVFAKEKENDGNDDEYAESASSSSSSKTTQTTTQVIKLPDQIVTKTIMVDVVLPDTDKDGLPDVSDPHPTIPEYLIVNDANGNGIDDNYDLSI